MNWFAGVVARLGVALAILLGPESAHACPGDCDGNLRVGVDELLRGVRMALGTEAECQGLDADGDGTVSIDELLRAVAASLSGCPEPSPSPTPTRTPTPAPNLPPVLPTASLYRAFAGHEIVYPIGATDPNGDPLICTAEDLPEGAELDESAVLTWTPAEEQIGAFEVPVTCTDDGEPPKAADGVLTFEVSPLDACVIPDCDPASGCGVELAPLEEACCGEPAVEQPDTAVVACPLGAAVSVSRDIPGFKPLRNCDLFRVNNMNQSGASVAFKLKARCVNTLNPVSVRIRMETGPPCSPPAPTPTPAVCRRPMVDFFQARAFLTAGQDGSTAPIRLTPAQVIGGTPFFDLQDAEANLVVTLRDSDGLEVVEKVRLILTFTPIPTEAPPSPTPTQTPMAIR